MNPIKFRGKETMSYNKVEQLLPPAEGAEQAEVIIDDWFHEYCEGRCEKSEMIAKLMEFARQYNPHQTTESAIAKIETDTGHLIDMPDLNGEFAAQPQPTAKGAEEWIKNLTELRINMQDLMLYYSKSGHDFTTPVIDILLEMREKCLDGSVIYSKIKSTVLWYPAKFIDWVNDNFYWDKGLDGYLPTTIKHQGMTFKTTDELLIYWAKDKHYSYHRKPMSNGLLPL